METKTTTCKVCDKKMLSHDSYQFGEPLCTDCELWFFNLQEEHEQAEIIDGAIDIVQASLDEVKENLELLNRIIVDRPIPGSVRKRLTKFLDAGLIMRDAKKGLNIGERYYK